MDMSGELHTSAALPPWKETLVLKASKPHGFQVRSGHFREEKCHASAGNRTPDLTANSPIIIMTEVPWL
jgi:hypothetical protein